MIWMVPYLYRHLFKKTLLPCSLKHTHAQTHTTCMSLFLSLRHLQSLSLSKTLTLPKQNKSLSVSLSLSLSLFFSLYLQNTYTCALHPPLSDFFCQTCKDFLFAHFLLKIRKTSKESRTLAENKKRNLLRKKRTI